MNESMQIWKVDYLDQTDCCGVVRTEYYFSEAAAYVAAGRWTFYGHINAVVTAVIVQVDEPTLDGTGTGPMPMTGFTSNEEGLL